MKLLLDSHFLLWTAFDPDRLSDGARQLIEDVGNDLLFSAASIWEIAIKDALGRTDFHCDPVLLRRGLLDNGYEELPITSAHAVAVGRLPSIHKDPFDRMLVAQAIAEGITLLTADARLASYPGPIRKL
jgi:PIN domain nuclease of toxin-antitoxin system